MIMQNTQIFIQNRANPILTTHAKKRSQQRGVNEKLVKLVAVHGKSEHAYQGHLLRMLRKKEIQKLLHYGLIKPADVDNLKGLQVITNENPERVLVITILNRNN